MGLRKELTCFLPSCPQEERDRELLLEALAQPGVMTRENPVEHFTASAWVVNQTGGPGADAVAQHLPLLVLGRWTRRR